MPPITKFTYLCELLDPKIKHDIDPFPFTAEVYKRAKSILQDRYGKDQRSLSRMLKIFDEFSVNPKRKPPENGRFQRAA